MADKKITELDELSGVMENTDVLPIVDDPTGSASTKKLQKRNFMTRYVQPEPFSMKDLEPCSTGNDKAAIHIPPDMDGLDLVYAHAEVEEAGTTSTMLIMVRNETKAQDMLTDRIMIDTGETGSDTAATPVDINTSNDDVSANDVIKLDFDQVHSGTPANGCIVTLGFG